MAEALNTTAAPTAHKQPPTLAELQSAAWKLQAVIDSAAECANSSGREAAHKTVVLIELATELAASMVAGIEQACEAEAPRG